MMSSRGGIRACGRTAESNVGREEEKEHFGAEWGGTGGGSQGRRKGSVEESGRERELRRRRRRWVAGGKERAQEESRSLADRWRLWSRGPDGDLGPP